MDAGKSQIKVATTPAVVTSCPRIKSDDGGSFVANFKNYFNEFINTPMENHKVCFKSTIQKMVDKFGGGMTSTWSPKDGENSATTSKEG